MVGNALSVFLRAAFDFAVRLFMALALFRAGRRAARAEAAERAARAHQREAEALRRRPRDRDELVRRLRDQGL